MLQIRITDWDGSNPVILENASNRVFAEAINSADDGIAFQIAKSDPKADAVNPYTDGYTKRWEVWDTATNVKLNFGPIVDITDMPFSWKVTGAGRVALLADFYQTKKTFYAPIYSIVEDISYENVAIQPRTSTLVPAVSTSTAQTTVFGNTVVIDERYHGLSQRTKDNAIDDNTGQFKINQIDPPNTYYSHDSYWSGMSRADTHIVDLGAIYDIKRLVYTLPTWGGPQRLSNRTYDYEIAIATDEGSTTEVQDKEFGTFTTIYSSADPSRVVGGLILYLGMDGTSIESELLLQGNSPTILALPPVPVRYIRMKITDVHAWFGTHFDDDASVDGWEYQCDPDYEEGDIGGLDNGPARMTEDINDRVLEPPNDCHASISEIEADQEIVPLFNVKPLALQRIDNNNLQIKYFHTPDASETKTTSSGYRKFEPGSFFRRVHVTYSGAGSSYTKFFDSDCTNCYPDGFHLGIIDDGNSLIYASDSSSGTNVNIKARAMTRNITMKGAANAVVTYCDAWPSKIDPLSWGASYSYTTVEDDYARIHFRGQSFRWYATVPEGETGATALLEIRSKTTGSWSSWTTLDTITLPSDIHSEVVYEIPYESGYFAADTVYEIKITNTDGGFLSIDSIEGFWSSSMVEYNEDSSRIFMGRPERLKQIYDKRFSNGSMYKISGPTWCVLEFVGDRVVVMGAKGRNHGVARILLLNTTASQKLYDPGLDNHVFIPGGEADGSLRVDLDTGKAGTEIPQYIMFDSDDYFPGGLPWGSYSIGVYMLQGDVETYTSNTADIEFDSFVSRCKDCETPTGDDITVNKPIFLDGMFVHEAVGLSVSFDNEQHLNILKATAEAVQVEWCVDGRGITMEPRIGQDTNIYLREGENTLVDWNIVNDVSEVATILLSHGADIDGLPLYTVTENKETRARLGRTVMRQQDFRNIASQYQLIGLSRTELNRRAYPPKRINISHIGNHLGLNKGDSFVIWTKKSGEIRVRILRKEISESGARQYNLECVTWPQTI